MKTFLALLTLTISINSGILNKREAQSAKTLGILNDLFQAKVGLLTGGGNQGNTNTSPTNSAPDQSYTSPESSNNSPQRPQGQPGNPQYNQGPTNPNQLNMYNNRAFAQRVLSNININYLLSIIQNYNQKIVILGNNGFQVQQSIAQPIFTQYGQVLLIFLGQDQASRSRVYQQALLANNYYKIVFLGLDSPPQIFSPDSPQMPQTLPAYTPPSPQMSSDSSSGTSNNDSSESRNIYINVNGQPQQQQPQQYQQQSPININVDSNNIINVVRNTNQKTISLGSSPFNIQYTTTSQINTSQGTIMIIFLGQDQNQRSQIYNQIMSNSNSYYKIVILGQDTSSQYVTVSQNSNSNTYQNTFYQNSDGGNTQYYYSSQQNGGNNQYFNQQSQF